MESAENIGSGGPQGSDELPGSVRLAAGVKLPELLRGVEADFLNDRNAANAFTVASISTNSRSLKKGDLFVALTGEKHDGHEFVAEALRKGVSAVLFETAKAARMSKLAAERCDVLFIGVENTRRALGAMARNHLGRLRVKKIAVTGSAGKTTTTRLVRCVLARKYKVVSSPRSYNNEIGVPLTAFAAGMDAEYLVQEIGTNHPGEIGTLSRILRQDCAVVTNVGPAHVGFFGSVDAVAKEKKSALECLESGGTAFLNADDRYFGFLSEGLRARVRSFGIDRGDLRPDRILEVGADSAEFVLGGVKVRAALAGLHGVLDATAAALVGRAAGLSFEEIAKGLADYTPEGGRGNVHRVGGVTIIDESYNANPLSLRASLEHFGKVKPKAKGIVVFADMLELGEFSERHHREVATDVLRCGADALFTFGELARITGEECKRLGFEHVSHFRRVEDIAAALKEEMDRGGVGCILVKGSRAMKLDRVVRVLVGR
jgi:UDP-N-acetylmuramoyl-tripeptide--D-alanyl-D-alanine ligase